MKKLPPPEIYEKEFTFLPWGKLINTVYEIVKDQIPKNGNVLDLMCGPGYLLGKIKEIRPDLSLKGIDFDADFIEYAQQKYSGIEFELADVLSWRSQTQYDLVLVTAGIHHLPYDEQEGFIQSIPSLLTKEGFCILADPYIDDYSNEKERKTAAAKLGYEYLVATIQADAPDDVLTAAIDLIYNDVMKAEYKTSIKKLLPVFQSVFKSVKTKKIWPDLESEYGEYLIELKA